MEVGGRPELLRCFGMQTSAGIMYGGHGIQTEDQIRGEIL